MNVLTSFVVTLITLFIDFLVEFKSSILFALFVGALVLSFNPAHAAVIQCNHTDCSTFTSMWTSLILERKAAVICIAFALSVTMYLVKSEKA